jgi:hypothetical protein
MSFNVDVSVLIRFYKKPSWVNVKLLFILFVYTMPGPANKVSFTDLYHCPFFENNSKPLIMLIASISLSLK